MSDSLFETAPVPKAYFAITLPVLGTGLLSLFYNLTDTFFVARTGITALVAGVSLCAPMLTIMVALGDVFGLGGSSIISRLFGKREIEEGGRVCSFSFYSGILVGLLYAVILLIFRRQILGIFGVTEETFSYACDYYTVLIFCAPASVVNTVIGNILRTDAMSTQAMIGQGAGNIINVILDPLMIFSLHMGAAGAALATVIGRYASIIIMLVLLVKKSERLSVSPKECRIPGREMLQLLAIGIPAGLTNIMNSLVTAVTNHMLLPYGTNVIAAMGIAQKVTMIVLIVVSCFTFGVEPLLGYNYGAANWPRLKEVIRFNVKVQIVISIVMAGVLFLLSPEIIRLFLNDTEIVSTGSHILRCLLLSTPFMSITLVFITLFQAEGKSLPALLMSFFRQGLFYCGFIVILSHFFGYQGILMTEFTADVLAMLTAILLYHTTKSGAETEGNL